MVSIFGRRSIQLVQYSAVLISLKPGPHQQQCRSNIVEATDNFVACCFDIVAVFGTKVERYFDVLLPKTARMSKQCSTYPEMSLQGILRRRICLTESNMAARMKE